MRDSRVSIWTNPTVISADGATNGPNIDLLGDYHGTRKHGTSLYGLPFEVLVGSVNTGTGDGFTLTVKTQVAPDNSGSPGSWRDDEQVGVFTIDTDGNILREDGSTKLNLTRGKLSGRLRTHEPWGRIVVTAAGITGGETASVTAYVSDGTAVFNDGVVR